MVVESNNQKLTIENVLSDESISVEKVLNFVRTVHNFLDNSGSHYVNHLAAVKLGVSCDLFEGIDESSGFDFSKLNKELQIAGLIHDFGEDLNKCIEKSGKDSLEIVFNNQLVILKKSPEADQIEFASDILRQMDIGEFAIQIMQDLSKEKLKAKEYNEIAESRKGELDSSGVTIEKKDSKLTDDSIYDLKEFLYLENKQKLSDKLKISVKELEKEPGSVTKALQVCKGISTLGIKSKDLRHNSIPDRYKEGKFAVDEFLAFNKNGTDYKRKYDEKLHPRIQKYNKAQKIVKNGLSFGFEALDKIKYKNLQINEAAKEFILEGIVFSSFVSYRFVII